MRKTSVSNLWFSQDFKDWVSLRIDAPHASCSVIWWERSGSCGHILWLTHEYLKLWDKKHRFLNRWNRYGGGRAEYLSSMNEDCIMWRSIVWRGHDAKRTPSDWRHCLSSVVREMIWLLSFQCFHKHLADPREANAWLSSTARRALFPPRVSFSANIHNIFINRKVIG